MADSESKTSQELLAQAIDLHNKGVEGDKEAVKQAHRLLKEFCMDYPDNLLAEAYLGSSTALLGRDEIEPNKRFKLVLEGLKILDGTVSKASDNIEIRTIRGYVCYRLPEMYFHRLTTAVEDFSNLASRFEKNRKVFSKDFYCKILYDLGSAYKQLERFEEAHETWRKLLKVTNDTTYKELLKQEGFVLPGKGKRKRKSRRS